MSDYYISISDKEPCDDGILWFKISDALSEDEAYIVNKGEYQSLKSDFLTALTDLENVDKVKQVVMNIVEDTGFSVSNAETGYKIVNPNNPQLQYNYQNIKNMEDNVDELESSIDDLDNYIATTLRIALDSKLDVGDIETELKSNSAKPVASSTIKAEFDKYSWKAPTQDVPFVGSVSSGDELFFEINEGLGLAHLVLTYSTTVNKGYNPSSLWIPDKYCPRKTMRGICHNSSSGFHIIYVFTPSNGQNNQHLNFLSDISSNPVSVTLNIVYRYKGESS